MSPLHPASYNPNTTSDSVGNKRIFIDRNTQLHQRTFLSSLHVSISEYMSVSVRILPFSRRSDKYTRRPKVQQQSNIYEFTIYVHSVRDPRPRPVSAWRLLQQECISCAGPGSSPRHHDMLIYCYALMTWVHERDRIIMQLNFTWVNYSSLTSQSVPKTSFMHSCSGDTAQHHYKIALKKCQFSQGMAQGDFIRVNGMRTPKIHI